MSYYAEEHYAVYAEGRTTARKEHTCSACRGSISPGDIYYRVRWIYDGHVSGVKRCARCQHIHEHLRAKGDGDMWPDERLDCGEEYAEHWGHEPPAAIAALAFWLPGEPLPAMDPCGDIGRWARGVCRDGWGLYWRCQRAALQWEHWPSRCSGACT